MPQDNTFYRDTFALTADGNTLRVERIDCMGCGWGMRLLVMCTPRATSVAKAAYTICSLTEASGGVMRLAHPSLGGSCLWDNRDTQVPAINPSMQLSAATAAAAGGAVLTYTSKDIELEEINTKYPGESYAIKEMKGNCSSAQEAGRTFMAVDQVYYQYDTFLLRAQFASRIAFQ